MYCANQLVWIYRGLGTCQKLAEGAGRVENRGGSQSFEPFKREGYEKKRPEKREGHKKLSHHDGKGML